MKKSVKIEIGNLFIIIVCSLAGFVLSGLLILTLKLKTPWVINNTVFLTSFTFLVIGLVIAIKRTFKQWFTQWNKEYKEETARLNENEKAL